MNPKSENISPTFIIKLLLILLAILIAIIIIELLPKPINKLNIQFGSLVIHLETTNISLVYFVSILFFITIIAIFFMYYDFKRLEIKEGNRSDKNQNNGSWLVLVVTLALLLYFLITTFMNGFQVNSIFLFLLTLISLITFLILRR